MLKLITSVLLSGMLLFSTFTQAQWTDLGDIQFDYSSRPTFDRVNQSYSSVVTLTNVGSHDINGPMRLMIDSTNHEILNADGEEQGIPFKILSTTEFVSGGSSSLILKLELKRALVEYNLRLQADIESNGPVLELAADQIAIFYSRKDNNYAGWGLHLWNGEGCGNYASPTTDSEHFANWSNPYPADGVDADYGAYFILTVEPNNNCHNFILHKGDEKALGSQNSRFEPARGQEGFTFHGDPQIWYEPLTSQPLSISGARAHWLDNNSILWQTDTNTAVSYALYHSANGDLDDLLMQGLPTQNVINMQSGAVETSHLEALPHLAAFSGFAIELTDEQAKVLAKQQLLAVAKDAQGDIVDITRVQISTLLDYLYTRGADDADEATLGVNYADNNVEVAVWAPTATQVNLQLFNQSKTLVANHVMTLNPQSGVWGYQAPKAAVDKLFYRYEVSVYHPATEQNEVLYATDPYSVSVATNGRYSQFVDLLDMQDQSLVPSGWEEHSQPASIAPEDMVIYETHIRDFSILDQSTPAQYRGKYLAFTQSNSAPVQHLQSLKNAGLTHVHLLPANDIASINEDRSQRIEVTDTAADLCARVADAPVCGNETPSATLLEVLQSYEPNSTQAQALVNAMRGLDGFNWGYDPHHFAAPEGSYATDPDGPARVKEMRAMVMALHEMDLAVVLDVVYNHTASSGLFDNSVLDKLVPGYYHRLSETSGNIENSTCCENTATEQRMMAKLMNESLVSFAQHFGFDSFRFDLMGHIPKQAILDAREAVRAVDPDTYFYGEGWNFGEVVNDRRFVQSTQFNMAGTAVGSFNDRIREGVRSAALFKANGSLNDQDIIRLSMAGNLQDYAMVTAGGAYITGKEYQWNGQPAAYAKNPADSINYVSKHDNETLWDQLQYNLPVNMSLQDRTRVQAVALSIPLLSQGIPFLHMGSDLLRSKSMDRNTYDAGDWFNQVDFTGLSSAWNIGLPLAQDNQGKWSQISEISANLNSAIDATSIDVAKNLFTDFLAIRSSSALFRLKQAEQVSARVKFHNTGIDQVQGLIVMSIDDGLGLPDLDPKHDAILVIVNGSSSTQSFSVNHASGFELHNVQVNSLDTRLTEVVINGEQFSVPPLTTAVFVKPQQGAQGYGLSALPPYGDQPLYLRGSMNSWGTDLVFSYQGNDSYILETALVAGDYEFKLADQDFATANIGGGFNVPIGSPATLTNHANNLSLSILEDAVYRFELDASNAANPILLLSSDSLTPPVDTGPYNNTIYLRGAMNGWGTGADFAFEYQGNNVYQLSVDLAAQQYGFKVANENWDAPNIGGYTAGQVVELDQPWDLTSSNSHDLSVNISSAGLYLFSLNASNPANPVLTISADLPPFAQTLYLRGAMNNWGTSDPLTYVGAGVYRAAMFVSAATHNFKVAQDNWALQYGSGQTTNVDEPMQMYQNASDAAINILQDGQYQFLFNLSGETATMTISAQ
jgi:pullulanase